MDGSTVREITISWGRAAPEKHRQDAGQQIRRLEDFLNAFGQPDEWLINSTFTQPEILLRYGSRLKVVTSGLPTSPNEYGEIDVASYLVGDDVHVTLKEATQHEESRAHRLSRTWRFDFGSADVTITSQQWWGLDDAEPREETFARTLAARAGWSLTDD